MPMVDSEPPDFSKPHAPCVHDMVRMKRLENPKPSPDGKWVVFVRKVWDPEADKSTANLWLVSIDGTTIRRLTSVNHLLLLLFSTLFSLDFFPPALSSVTT